MTGYRIVNLKLVVEELGEDHTKLVLSHFSCSQNPDVEQFLRTKAIEFSKQGLARTHLVMASYQKKPEIIGYFSLANKSIIVNPSKLNAKTRSRLNRFGNYDSALKTYCIAAPLIAQLGKNFDRGLNKLITGNELLELACQKLRAVQMDLGGGFVYLECEDKPELVQFYERNHFTNFDKRMLDKDETNLSGEYLLQMIRYL